ncbi:hypothetical protein B5S29_g2299 [[Candida] boidinii]|nr:hypothetical protein B5S29_g2299 [[Candida] boidinii]
MSSDIRSELHSIANPSGMERINNANSNNNEYSSSILDDSDNGQKRKKKRVSFACSMCRSRKIKCDKQKPICGSCTKSGIPRHQCNYDEVSPWIQQIGGEVGDIQPGENNGKENNQTNNISVHDSVVTVNPHLNNSLNSPVSTSYSSNYNSEVPENQNLDLVKSQLQSMKNMIKRLEQQIESAPSNSSVNGQCNNIKNQYHNTNSEYNNVSSQHNNIKEANSRPYDIPILSELMNIRRPNFIFNNKGRDTFFTFSFGSVFAHHEKFLQKVRLFSEIMFASADLWTDSSNESNEEKKLSESSEYFVYQTETFEEDNFIRMMSLVLPKYEGILERFKYFQKHLSILFDFLDINVVEGYLKANFKVGLMGEIIFHKLEKSSIYSEVALVLAVLALTSLFSTGHAYNNPYKDTIGKLIYLTEKALSLSSFLRKQSIPSLHTLLILRAIKVYDPKRVYEISLRKGYSIFQEALNISISMGLHRDPESIKSMIYKDIQLPLSISKRAWRKTWNSMKILDDYYSSRLVTPQLIEEHYSDCSSVGVYEHNIKIFKLSRGIVERLCSDVDPISINEIIGCLDKLIRFCAFETDPFEDLIQKNSRYSPTEEELDLMVLKLSSKLKIFEKIISLEAALSTILLKDDFSDLSTTKISDSDRITMKSLGMHYALEAYKLSVFVFILYSKCLSPYNAYEGKEKYIKLITPHLKTVLYSSFFLIFSLSLDATTILTRSPYNDSMSVRSVPLNYESCLYKDVKPVQLPELLALDKKIEDTLTDSRLNMILICEFLIKSVDYISDRDFFINYKSFMLFCSYTREVAFTTYLMGEPPSIRIKERFKIITGESKEDISILSEKLGSRSINEIYDWLTNGVDSRLFRIYCTQTFEDFKCLLKCDEEDFEEPDLDEL